MENRPPYQPPTREPVENRPYNPQGQPTPPRPSAPSPQEISRPQRPPGGFNPAPTSNTRPYENQDLATRPLPTRPSPSRPQPQNGNQPNNPNKARYPQGNNNNVEQPPRGSKPPRRPAPNGRPPVRQTPRPQLTSPPVRPFTVRPQRPQRPQTPAPARPQTVKPEKPQGGLPIRQKPGYPDSRPQQTGTPGRPSQTGGPAERPPQIGLPPRPQIPATKRPQQAPNQTPNAPKYPSFGQKLPGFAGAETLEEKDTNDLRERDYTAIDTPSRGPESKGTPKPNYYEGGNRYEINGAGVPNTGNRIPYQDNRPRKQKPSSPPQVDPLPVIEGTPNIGTKFGVDVQKSDIVRDFTITNSRGQPQIIQTRYNGQEGQQIDPSFYNEVQPSATKVPTPYIDKTVAVGLAVGGNEAGSAGQAGQQGGQQAGAGQFGLVRGTVEPPTTDYQGWYTEGDSIGPLKPTTSTSRYYFDINYLVICI